jgi:hypothetical protein
VLVSAAVVVDGPGSAYHSAMRHRATPLILALATIVITAAVPSQSLQTPAEASRYTRYTQHPEVASFLDVVSKASTHVKVLTVGRTGEAANFAPVDLRLVVVTEEGAATPSSLNRKKPTVLVLAAQHGNEQSGKEAALTLVRDLAVGDLAPLLKRVNVLVMPQTNPYGNWMDRRPNEQGLDLNRDHVKLESPETRAIHSVFTAWMPEVSLDLHEKGYGYYQVNTGCVTNANIAAAIRQFSQRVIFKETEAVVTAGGATWHEYLVTEAMGSQGAAGAPEPADEKDRPTLTRPSTTDLNDGRNSLGIYETISFIQEGASRHDIETLRERTAYVYLGVKALVQSVARHAGEVLRLVGSSRASLAAKAAKPDPGDLVHLRMVHARDPNEPELTIRSFEELPAGAGASTSQPRVITMAVKNWFPAVQPTRSVPRAAGYLVPADRVDVIQTLRAHGIAVRELTADTPVEVEQYVVNDVTPASEDYVAPEKIDVARKAARITAKKGDCYVSGAQPAANLVPNLLEPEAEFGLIRYRAYKLVPEKGAVFPLMRVKTPIVP